MEVVIGSVCPEETEDIAIPEETRQRNNAVYGAKGHEIPLREMVRTGGIESG